MAVVLAAQWTTFDLKANGTISTFGYDFCKYDLGGQYDIFNWTDIIAISKGEDATFGLQTILGLKADGTVVAVGDNYYGQCGVTNWKLW